MTESKEQPESLTYTVDQVAAMLDLSRGATYEAVSRGEIPSLRFGRRLVVPRAAFERMLQAKAVSAAS